MTSLSNRSFGRHVQGIFHGTQKRPIHFEQHNPYLVSMKEAPNRSLEWTSAS